MIPCGKDDPLGDTAVFNFLDERLYKISIQYDSDRLTKLGGYELVSTLVRSKFGQPDSALSGFMLWKGVTPGRRLYYGEYMVRDGKSVTEGGDERAYIAIEDNIESEAKRRKEKSEERANTKVGQEKQQKKERAERNSIEGFGFRKVTLSTTLTQFRSQIPDARKFGKDSRIGESTFMLFCGKDDPFDSVVFRFIDERLCSIEIEYHSEKLIQLGGCESFASEYNPNLDSPMLATRTL